MLLRLVQLAVISTDKYATRILRSLSTDSRPNHIHRYNGDLQRRSLFLCSGQNMLVGLSLYFVPKDTRT